MGGCREGELQDIAKHLHTRSKSIEGIPSLDMLLPGMPKIYSGKLLPNP